MGLTQNYNATAILSVMDKHSLRAESTFSSLQSTFFGESDNKSRIDHWLLPQNCGALVNRYHTLPRAMRQVQLIHSWKYKDHKPVLLELAVELDFSDHQHVVNIDRDRLMAACTEGGQDRVEFVHAADMLGFLVSGFKLQCQFLLLRLQVFGKLVEVLAP